MTISRLKFILGAGLLMIVLTFLLTVSIILFGNLSSRSVLNWLLASTVSLLASALVTLWAQLSLRRRGIS